jgi:hypothetical protein
VASTYAERPNGEAMRRSYAEKLCGEARRQRPDGEAIKKLDYKRLGPFK